MGYYTVSCSCKRIKVRFMDVVDMNMIKGLDRSKMELKIEIFVCSF